MDGNFPIKVILSSYLKSVTNAFNKEQKLYRSSYSLLTASYGPLNSRDSDIHGRSDAEKCSQHFYNTLGFNIFKKIIEFWWCYSSGKYVRDEAVAAALIEGVRVGGLPEDRTLVNSREPKIPEYVKQLPASYLDLNDPQKLEIIGNLIMNAQQLIQTDVSANSLFTFIFDLNDMSEEMKSDITRRVDVMNINIPGYVKTDEPPTSDRSEIMKNISLQEIQKFFQKTDMGKIDLYVKKCDPSPKCKKSGLFGCCSGRPTYDGGSKRKKTRRKTVRRKTVRKKTVRRKTVRRKTVRRKTVRRKTVRRKKKKTKRNYSRLK
jgi:hypothetical protein